MFGGKKNSVCGFPLLCTFFLILAHCDGLMIAFKILSLTSRRHHCNDNDKHNNHENKSSHDQNPDSLEFHFNITHRIGRPFRTNISWLKFVVKITIHINWYIWYRRSITTTNIWHVWLNLKAKTKVVTVGQLITI